MHRRLPALAWTSWQGDSDLCFLWDVNDRHIGVGHGSSETGLQMSGMSIDFRSGIGSCVSASHNSY